MSQIDKKLAALLEPGTVWVRPDSGKKVTILCVLNTSLKGENAKKFPVQVAYIDEKGNRLAVPIDRFVQDREYYLLDPIVSRRLETLMDPVEAEQETTGPAIDLEPDEKGLEHPEGVQEGEDVGPQDVEALPPPALYAQFVSSSETELPPVDPITLSNNVMQYEQDPHIDSVVPGLSYLRHKLVIALAEGMTLQSLNDSFSPPFENAPFYKEFAINGIRVDWEDYQGAYPVIANDGVFASVVFVTRFGDAALNELDAGVEEEQVQVQSTPESVTASVGDSTVTVHSNGDVHVTAPTVSVNGTFATNPVQAAIQPEEVPVQAEASIQIRPQQVTIQPQPVQAQVQPQVVAQPEDEPKFKIIDDDAADEAVLFGNQ